MIMTVIFENKKYTCTFIKTIKRHKKFLDIVVSKGNRAFLVDTFNEVIAQCFINSTAILNENDEHHNEEMKKFNYRFKF